MTWVGIRGMGAQTPVIRTCQFKGQEAWLNGMNLKLTMVCLALGCVVLAGLLYHQHTTALDQQAIYDDHLTSLSNRLSRTSALYYEQLAVNEKLLSDLHRRVTETRSLNHHVSTLKEDLDKTKTRSVVAAESAAQALKKVENELVRRDQTIDRLEEDRIDLTQRLHQLDQSIDQLQVRIRETEDQLTTAEGDRELLLGELKRLKEERDSLEQQFSNLTALRAQVKHLKNELTVRRRLSWIRRGLFGGRPLKGAERMVRRNRKPPPLPNPDLDVIMRRDDGTATIVTPQTTAPARPR